MTPPVLALARWVWPTTTVFAVIVTCSLLVVLVTYCLIAAFEGPDSQAEARWVALKPALARAAVPLLVAFAIVVLVRFGIILYERPHA